MFKRFFPQDHVDSIYHINYKALYDKGIRGLIFDIDNTLVPFDIELPTYEIIELFDKLKEDGFQIALLSNNGDKRVKRFNEPLNLPCESKAGKPKFSGINKVLKMLNLNEDKVVLIGDQIFTDIWCGNRKKIHTILVKPIANRDEFTVKLKRGIEKWVLSKYKA